MKTGLLIVVVAFTSSAGVFAQPDTVFVPGDVAPAEGGLNAAVLTASDAGKLSTTVFRLEPNGRYVLNGTITVPAGERLTITAPEPGMTQAAAPPRIMWSADHSLNTSVFFDCRGDIALHNLWLLYATTEGWHSWSSVVIEDSPDSLNGQRGNFDGVIFDYAGIGAEGSGCVCVKARHFRGGFRNCYFRNCADPHFRYYGRAVSFPFMSTEWHTDSLRFDHCTFANIGYVYMQENGEYADHLWFNHCTFLNVMMFPLESGWWRSLNVSNSIFVNTYMWGDLPWERQPDTAQANGGTISIDSISTFGFSVPFPEAERHILFTHSSYMLEPWLRGYIESGYDGTLDSTWLPRSQWPRPQPMMNARTRSIFKEKSTWPYVSMGPVYDSTDPGFARPPTSQIGIKRFLWIRLTSGADTAWAYNPQDDLDGVWPMKEDLSFSNPLLLKAGMGGLPLGDLVHWFPDRYVEWNRKEAAENLRIRSWLATGLDPGESSGVDGGEESGAPVQFELQQNFPNPFNGISEIGFAVSDLSEVTLQVFDLLGREVASLVNERKAAGNYRVAFDGSKLASGVYFYRLQARSRGGGHEGVFIETRKMVLIR